MLVGGVALLFVCALKFHGGNRGPEADLDSDLTCLAWLLVLLLFWFGWLVCFLGVAGLALGLRPCTRSASDLLLSLF